MQQRILVLGTTNRKKRGELEELLADDRLLLRTLADYPPLPEVDEDGETFAANAAKKATTIARMLNAWVLGEDSGLCVDALGGAPGIYSARYAGEPRDDERNNDKLLAALADVPDQQRTAYYVCSAALADPSGAIRATAEGRCHGTIRLERAGRGGFGYDPLFHVPDAGLTFGELPAAYKQQHSHRAHAIRLLKPKIDALLRQGDWPAADPTSTP